MLRLIIATTDTREHSRWDALFASHPGVDYSITRSPADLKKAILATIAQTTDDHCCIVHGDTLLDPLAKEALLKFPATLEDDFGQDWGVIGNGGLSLNGTDLIHFGTPSPGIEKAKHPLFVATLDCEIVFLNIQKLRTLNFELPDLGHIELFPFVFSLECARHTLPSFVDSRLSGFSNARFLQKSRLSMCEDKAFRAYWGSHFINHEAITRDGRACLREAIDFKAIDFLGDFSQRADIHNLYFAARAKSAASNPPSVTIVCRTMLNREALIKRAFSSIASAAVKCPLIKLNVLLLTPVEDKKKLADLSATLRRLYPRLDIVSYVVPIPGHRYSRTEQCLFGLKQSTGDYTWFLDDDDFIFPDSLKDILGAINREKSNFVIGSCQVFDETWTSKAASANDLSLDKASQGDCFHARNWLNSFSGTNHIPICGILFPTQLMQEQILGLNAIGDYTEDYFLIMVSLSHGDAEVRLVHKTIAGIAYHNRGSTVVDPNPEKWLVDQATFTHELVNTPRLGSPVFWKLAGTCSSLASKAGRNDQKLGLFWSDTELFSREHSSTQDILLSEGANREYRFQISNLDVPKLQSIRFDAGEIAGLIGIDSIDCRLKRPNTEDDQGETISFNSGNGYHGLRFDHHIAPLSEQHHRGLWVLATGEDPIISFTFECPDLDGSEQLDFRVRLTYLPLDTSTIQSDLLQKPTPIHASLLETQGYKAAALRNLKQRPWVRTLWHQVPHGVQRTVKQFI